MVEKDFISSVEEYAEEMKQMKSMVENSNKPIVVTKKDEMLSLINTDIVLSQNVLKLHWEVQAYKSIFSGISHNKRGDNK